MRPNRRRLSGDWSLSTQQNPFFPETQKFGLALVELNGPENLRNRFHSISFSDPLA